MKYGKSICLLTLALSAQQLFAAAYSNDARLVIQNNTDYSIIATIRVLSESGSEAIRRQTLNPYETVIIPEPRSRITTLGFTVPQSSYPAFIYDVTSEIRQKKSESLGVSFEKGYTDFYTNVATLNASALKGLADIGQPEKIMPGDEILVRNNTDDILVVRYMPVHAKATRELTQELAPGTTSRPINRANIKSLSYHYKDSYLSPYIIDVTKIKRSSMIEINPRIMGSGYSGYYETIVPK